jgi:hypothetical protein
MKKALTVVALALAGVITLGAVAYSSVVFTSAHDGQEQIIDRGGVIRLGKTVTLLTNSTHASVGLTRTTLINKCYLRVYFDTAAGEKVLSVTVDEDESVSKLDVQAGASGGNGFANIYLYRKGKPICANNTSFGNYSNLWIRVQHIAPKQTPVESLTPAPPATPPVEAQQKSVPAEARASIPTP